MAPPKLYTYQQSGNSYKVRLLASLLGIQLEHVEIDYIAREQSSPAFLAVNPRGQIPALVVDGRTYTDSAAILVYLAGTHGDARQSQAPPSSFWSADPAAQAEIVDWLGFTAGWLQSGIAVARVMVVFHLAGDVSSASLVQKRALADAQAKAHRSLEILEARLRESEWLALGRPTIADVAVFAYAALAPVGGVELKGYPGVERWIERVRGLKGFVSMDE